MRYDAKLCNKYIQCDAMQYNVMQYDAIQCSRMECNTIQYQYQYRIPVVPVIVPVEYSTTCTLCLIASSCVAHCVVHHEIAVTYSSPLWAKFTFSQFPYV